MLLWTACTWYVISTNTELFMDNVLWISAPLSIGLSVCMLTSTVAIYRNLYWIQLFLFFLHVALFSSMRTLVCVFLFCIYLYYIFLFLYKKRKEIRVWYKKKKRVIVIFIKANNLYWKYPLNFWGGQYFKKSRQSRSGVANSYASDSVVVTRSVVFSLFNRRISVFK